MNMNEIKIQSIAKIKIKLFKLVPKLELSSYKK